jgi:hypothetical protein
METSVPVLPLTTHGGAYGHDAAVVRTDPLLGTLIAEQSNQSAHRDALRAVEDGIRDNAKEIIENRHQAALKHGEILCRLEQVKNDLQMQIFTENDKTRDRMVQMEKERLAAEVHELKADIRLIKHHAVGIPPVTVV